MRHFATYQKHLACLESLWDSDVENRLSVVPLLQLVADLNEVRFAHLTCNTLAEFRFNMALLPRRRRYKVLYLATHGNPGEVILADGTRLTLENLAETMKRRFATWIIHFGTCGTLATARSCLQAFLDQTGVAMLLGYKKDVDWAESAALDLIVLDKIQKYRDMRAMWSQLARSYRDLIRITGFRAFPAV